MKLFVLLVCLTSALAFSVDDVDFENLVPLQETVEWQAAHPELAAAQPKTERTGRIWGGRLANHGELPYQVGILILLTRQSFCGGSIVSNNFVVTAAQCFPGDPNAVIEIGHVDRNLTPEFINAAVKILHPFYDVNIFKVAGIIFNDFFLLLSKASNNDNDIALVRLVRSIVFNANVQPVRLPNRRQVPQTFENQQARISGWGTSGSGEAAPLRNLRVAFGQVISQTACRIRFPSSSSDRTLCIVSFTFKFRLQDLNNFSIFFKDGANVNFCNGDFGGPVTIQDADQITTQIGIASFVNTLGCTRGFPGGFVRVTAYLDWIGQNSDVVIRETF